MSELPSIRGPWGSSAEAREWLERQSAPASDGQWPASSVPPGVSEYGRRLHLDHAPLSADEPFPAARPASIEFYCVWRGMEITVTRQLPGSVSPRPGK